LWPTTRSMPVGTYGSNERMAADHWVIRPIGYVRSPHQAMDKTPIQPVFAPTCEGRIELGEQYAAGLKDIEGFSHLHVVYWMHRSGQPSLVVKPFLEDREHGLFATRAPARPNPIGLSIVRLVRREGNVLHVAGVDMLDGTPVLDIKPYIVRFDCIADARSGWQDGVDDGTAARRGVRGWDGGAEGTARA
jgi:tRNA-Thr(GGU) m(6)t(6)A37 methyltransferase TsaA